MPEAHSISSPQSNPLSRYLSHVPVAPTKTTLIRNILTSNARKQQSAFTVLPSLYNRRNDRDIKGDVT